MVGNCTKPQPALLVSAQEAVHLGKNYGTVDTLYIAQEIAEEYYKTLEAEEQTGLRDHYYEFIMLCSILFDAGRLQGIREERAKRR